MTHYNKTMVSLKTGLSFAWLDKDLNKKLREVLRPNNRITFIKNKAKEQFGLSLDTKLDLLKFDEELKKNHYQDRADWLREICRNKIKLNKIENNNKIL